MHKKNTYFILVFLFVLVLIDVFFVRYFFKDKIMSTDIIIPFGNSCVVDDDCMITKYYEEFGSSCPDRVVDYSEDKYVAVNRILFGNYVKEEKQNDVEEKIDINDKNKLLGLEKNACLAFQSQYKNTNYQSTCYKQECKKVRRSFINKF